jgi:hypothetical protein
LCAGERAGGCVGERVGERAGEHAGECVGELAGERVSMPNVPADTSTKTFMLQIAGTHRLTAKLKIKN